MKTECLMNWQDMSAEEVNHDIVDYIEMLYSNKRLHSFSEYYSPSDYEKLMVMS